ncbi:MAG TPA: helix-turn-helix domain-containing protein [Terriglobales bacterium]|nr:helix-turn-helix domain-containing protein [Terriglobales bacterium]
MSATTVALDYPTLVSKAEPKVIHEEALNEKFISLLSDLDSRWESLSSAERELHELLVLLIEEFESRAYKLRASTPIEAIAELMEANGLKQKDLVGVFETASVVSEVLSGKRELTKDHIKRLSVKFNVSPALFF